MESQIKLNQRGVTLVEMVVTLGVVGILGLIIVNVSRYAERQAKIQIEDVQTMIAKLGASKIMTRDLANSTPSFNYINLEDDLTEGTPRPFFVYAKNEYCQETASNICKREYKLTIPDGQTNSKPFFIITIRGYNGERLKFPIAIETDVFSSTAPYGYLGLNHTDHKITRNEVPDSPWMKDRLMILSSNNDYYDCFNKVKTMGNTPCGPTVTCLTPGTCDYVAKREFKMLGIVRANEADMDFRPVKDRATLLKTNYNICSVNDSMGCAGTNITANITSSETLFKKMPFSPGLDNGASLSPVELIRYHLERPAPNSPDHQIRLFRSMASLDGSELSFQRAHILMTGVQSIVFTRPNISNPTIEYKIIKARTQQSIK